MSDIYAGFSPIKELAGRLMAIEDSVDGYMDIEVDYLSRRPF